MSTFDVRRPREAVEPFVERLMPLLDRQILTMAGEGDVEYTVMGSLRRARDGENTDVGDLDLIVWCPVPEMLVDLREMTWPSGIEATAKKASGWVLGEHPTDRLMVDAWLCPQDALGPMAVFLTGPARLNVWMRQITVDRQPGWMLSQYGVFEAVPHPTRQGIRVAGARLDVPFAGLDVDEAEEWFWGEWCRLLDLGDAIPYCPPSERSEVARRYLLSQRPRP